MYSIFNQKASHRTIQHIPSLYFYLLKKMSVTHYEGPQRIDR